MKDYYVTLRGEDRTEFTEEHRASSPDEVIAWAEERWPEATVLEVFDPVARQEAVEDRVRRMMDDDYYYDD